MNPCEICDGSNCDFCCMSCEGYDTDSDRCKADGCCRTQEKTLDWNLYDELLEMLGRPAAYEGLAEEAAELSRAALKVARIIRGENPTPMSLEDAKKAVIEEYTDLQIYAFVLALSIDLQIHIDKFQRMKDRILKMKEGDRK